MAKAVGGTSSGNFGSYSSNNAGPVYGTPGTGPVVFTVALNSDGSHVAKTGHSG